MDPVKNTSGKTLEALTAARGPTEPKQPGIEKEITLELLEIINRNSKTADLMKAALAFLQQRSGCEAAGIRLKDGDDFPYCVARGFPAELIRMESRIARDSLGNPHAECMCAQVIFGQVDASKPFISPGGSFWTNSMERTGCGCNEEGYGSVALIPLHVGSERLGLIQLSDRGKNRFSLEIVALWERLACYLAIALAKSRAEEQLREQCGQLQMTLAGIGDAVIATDPAERISFINPAASALTGWPPGEALKRPAREVFRIINEITGEMEEEVISGVLQTGRTVAPAGPTVLITRDGRRVPVESGASPLKDGSDRVTGVVLVFRDITERRRALESIGASEERLRLFIENAPASLAMLDRDMRYISYSRRWLTDYHLGDRDLKGLCHYDVFPEISERSKAILRRALAGEVLRENEDSFERSDGSILWVKWEVRPWHDSLGKIAGIVIYTEDLSEHKQAERLLRESEQQFRTLVESAPDAIFIQLDGRFAYVNDAAIRLYGAGSQKDLLGSVVMDRVHPAYRAEIFDRIRSVSEQRKSTPLMLQKHFRFDGTTVDVECRSVPVKYRKSEGALVFVRNITAHLKTEESLMLSESRYRRLFEDAVLGIFRATPQGKVIMVNPAYVRMFGFESAEEAKSQINDVATDLYVDPARRHEIVRMILETSEPLHVENLYKRKDGSRFIGNLHAWAVRDREGELLYLEGFVEDITERKHAEMKLRESEFNLRTILQTANEGFWAIDNDTSTKDINRKMCIIMGREREEVVGRKIYDFVDAENRSIFERQMSLRAQGLPGTYEIALCRPDGSQVFCQFNATPLWDDSGKQVGAFAMVTDITERKRAELENLRLEAQLRQSQKLEAIGTLAGGIAHDFNNILQPIMGYTEMVLNELSPASPFREDLEQVLSGSVRAKELVKQILAISRTTNEQQRIPTDISPIIKEALKFLRASLPTSLEIRDSIESGMALADPTQIHQVLMNLCTNAAHAMGEKGVLEVSLSNVRLRERDLARHSLIDLKPGRYLELSVSDTGCGMDELTAARIFDPYFTTKEVGKGSGLGLAVVNGIVKRHEGAVIVRSEPGKGSIFSVYIPSIDVQSGGAIEPDDSRPSGSERIIIVDDEPNILTMGKRLLNHLGYTVIPKTDSLDALDVFRSRPYDFDLLITDYTMPELTGLDLAREIRKIRPDMPVLLCTGFSEKVSHVHLDGLGIELLMKPYTIMELSTKVRMILDRTAGGIT